MASRSGSSGESSSAISSALTKVCRFSSEGRMVYDAVVFPAPLHPDMMKSLGIAAYLIRNGSSP